MRNNDNSGQPGRIYIFEGPDGVGKTTLIEHVAELLIKKQHNNVLVFSFPGKEEGTIGKVVYELHHDPKAFNIDAINNVSLQVLHIAAHIDCIQHKIKPALASGKIVLLDRYWWSTMAYGVAYGIPSNILDAMIELEKMTWGNILPVKVFLISRNQPYRIELNADIWNRVANAYSKIAENEEKYYSVEIINNDGDVKCITNKILSSILPNKQRRLQLYSKENTTSERTSSFSKLQPQKNKTYGRWLPTKTTPVFDTYWKFAAERQSIFFKRLIENNGSFTEDAILKTYKFTNAYRASDRVSQYLIRHVIYEGEQSPEEVFFRIILFKTFNKIETWKLLKERMGMIYYKDYNFNDYDKTLSRAMAKGHSIYSSAYIMPSGAGSFGHKYKHRNHLKLFEKMMSDNLPSYICESKSLQDVFELLRQYPMIGDFLAYQYTIDINYSELTNFSEMSFVVPGPGAKDGIRKCFSDYGGFSEIDLIKCMADRQEEEFSRLGIEFQSLWGRPLQLIDCQNLFCEVDKYARMAHPEAIGLSGRKRIKQKFRVTYDPIDFFYPPKWGINKAVNDTMKALKKHEARRK